MRKAAPDFNRFFLWVFLGDEGFQVPLVTCTQSYPEFVASSPLKLWRKVINLGSQNCIEGKSPEV